MQNATGGFGGGHGQMSHCAPSFAAVLSLALVGGDETFQIIDRQAMCVASHSLFYAFLI
jgi:protein farnesyltransferase subunit beta